MTNKTTWEQSEIAVTDKLKQLAGQISEIFKQLLALHLRTQRTKTILIVVGGILTVSLPILAIWATTTATEHNKISAERTEKVDKSIVSANTATALVQKNLDVHIKEYTSEVKHDSKAHLAHDAVFQKQIDELKADVIRLQEQIRSTP